MTVTSFPARVATKASTLDPARVLLTVLAAPFYLLGLIVGILWAVASWAVAAVAVGVSDARVARSERES